MGCQCIQNNDNMEIDDQMTSKENSEKDIKDIEDENNNNSPKNDDLFNGNKTITEEEISNSFDLEENYNR